MNSAIASATAIFQTDGRRRVLLSLATLLALALLVLWPTGRTLVAQWGNTEQLTYTHGWLIALVCAWLALRACRRLDDQSATVSWAIAPLLALASLTWLVALRAGIELGHQVVLPIVLWLAVWTALGRVVAGAMLFPLAYLYFAIPIWSLINGLLQHLTIAAMRVLLPIAGVAVYFDGSTVHIPSGVFEIASGCSGLHFFIVALAIATLYGELNRDPLRLRILLVVLAAGLAIFANWLRVFTIILAGDLTEMQHFLVRVDHYYFGWAVFAVAMGAFFLIARRLPLSQHDAAPSPDAASPRPAASWRWIAAVLVALAAVSVGPAWALVQSRATAAVDSGSGESPGPDAVATVETQELWQPVFVKADSIERSTTNVQGQDVDVYIAAYRTQRQGKELIGYHNSVIGDSGAVVTRRATTTTPRGPVTELLLSEPDGSAALVWYAYAVDARWLTRPLAVQLTYGIQSLWSAPIARVVALRSTCTLPCAAERAALAEAWLQVPDRNYKGTEL